MGTLHKASNRVDIARIRVIGTLKRTPYRKVWGVNEQEAMRHLAQGVHNNDGKLGESSQEVLKHAEAAVKQLLGEGSLERRVQKRKGVNIIVYALPSRKATRSHRAGRRRPYKYDPYAA